MKNQGKAVRKCVKLDPELEAIAGNWSAIKRIQHARKIKRWYKQLFISGKTMLQEANESRRSKYLFCLPRQRQKLN